MSNDKKIIHIDKALHRTLKQLSFMKEVTLQELTEGILRDYLNETEQELPRIHHLKGMVRQEENDTR